MAIQRRFAPYFSETPLYWDFSHPACASVEGLRVCGRGARLLCASGRRAPSPPRRLPSLPRSLSLPLVPRLLARVPEPGRVPASDAGGGEVTSPVSLAPLAFQRLARSRRPESHTAPTARAPPPAPRRRPRPCLSTPPTRTSRRLWTAVPRPTPRMTRPRRTCPCPRTTCGSPSSPVFALRTPSTSWLSSSPSW